MIFSLVLHDGKLHTEINLNSDLTAAVNNRNKIDNFSIDNKGSNGDSNLDNESNSNSKHIDNSGDKSDTNENYKNFPDRTIGGVNKKNSVIKISKYDTLQYSENCTEEKRRITDCGSYEMKYSDGNNNSIYDQSTIAKNESPRKENGCEISDVYSSDNKTRNTISNRLDSYGNLNSNNFHNETTYQSDVTSTAKICNNDTTMAIINDTPIDYDANNKEYINYDTVDSMSNNNSINLMINSHDSTTNTVDNLNETIKTTAGGTINIPENSSWTRECKLPNFSFISLPTVTHKSQDCILKIRTNMLPKKNISDDTNGIPIHHSLLKSMLQKAVRRKLTDTVVRLSFALASISTIELLRLRLIDFIHG